MKKFFVSFLVICMLVSSLVGCGNSGKTEVDKTEVNKTEVDKVEVDKKEVDKTEEITEYTHEAFNPKILGALTHRWNEEKPQIVLGIEDNYKELGLDCEIECREYFADDDEYEFEKLGYKIIIYGGCNEDFSDGDFVLYVVYADNQFSEDEKIAYEKEVGFDFDSDMANKVIGSYWGAVSDDLWVDIEIVNPDSIDNIIGLLQGFNYLYADDFSVLEDCCENMEKRFGN